MLSCPRHSCSSCCPVTRRVCKALSPGFSYLYSTDRLWQCHYPDELFAILSPNFAYSLRISFSNKFPTDPPESTPHISGEYPRASFGLPRLYRRVSSQVPVNRGESCARGVKTASYLTLKGIKNQLRPLQSWGITQPRTNTLYRQYEACFTEGNSVIYRQHAEVPIQFDHQVAHRARHEVIGILGLGLKYPSRTPVRRVKDLIFRGVTSPPFYVCLSELCGYADDPRARRLANPASALYSTTSTRGSHCRTIQPPSSAALSLYITSFSFYCRPSGRAIL